MKKGEKFTAKIEIIGINPFVFVPEKLSFFIFEQAGKDKGPIPVKGTINGQEFLQTLVKYQGHWRLYLNTPMRVASNTEVGDVADFSLEYDPVPRETPMHPKLAEALNGNTEAKKVFESLPPSRKKEIIRYINHLKTEESIDKNVKKAISFLLGNQRWIGRDTAM